MLSRIVKVGLAGLLLCWGGNARAETVAAVVSADVPAYRQAYQGFVGELRERRPSAKVVYLDGSKTSNLAASVRSRGAEVIFAVGTEAAQAAKDCGLPVVFVMVLDPGKAHLSGNCTGVSLNIPVTEQFRVMKAAMPALKEVGVIYNPARSGATVREGQAVASSFGLRLRAIPANSEAELPRAMEKVKGVELIWATVDATVYGSQSARYVLQYALRNNIPVMGFSENMVEAGALFAAYPDFASMGAQGAGLVVRVLSGEPAGSIPAVSPREVATCVNTRVANALRVRLPAAFLKQAGRH